MVDPVAANYLYRFETPSAVFNFTDVAESQDYNSETYSYIQINHTAPKFSEEPQDAEIDVTIHENNAIASLFVLGPPPYRTKLQIYEYDRDADTVTDYYRGWIVRPSFDLDNSLVSFHLKTSWLFFERESFTDSLSALSRYSIYDPRSGVDIEQFRTGITVTALNNERDVLTVTGITDIDGWFKGGLFKAPDQDMRTIIKHETVGGAKKLTLNAAFPRFTLDTGFTSDIYPGDDLTYETWANKFGSATNFGEAFGGWPFMPTKDPSVRGVI